MPPPQLRLNTDSAPAASPKRSFVAVENAQKVGVKACLPILTEESAANIDVDHAATSTWNKEDPDHRIYSALSFLTYPNDAAPRALVATMAAPIQQSNCDGSTIRIQPSRLACDQIATNIAGQSNSGKPEMIGDVRVYPPVTAGMRIILMPAATTGCVVVSSGTFFGR